MGHLADNNETYWSHLKFAGGIGVRMLYTGAFFLMHGIFPAIHIPQGINLDETFRFFEKSKSYADGRVGKKT
jgi:hypothetical protein